MNDIDRIANLLKPYHGYTVRGGEVYRTGTSQVLSDWEIAGAILERVAEITSEGERVYEIDIESDRFNGGWDVTVRFEATEYVFGGSDIALSIIGACVQVPEAQQATARGDYDAKAGHYLTCQVYEGAQRGPCDCNENSDSYLALRDKIAAKLRESDTASGCQEKT